MQAQTQGKVMSRADAGDRDDLRQGQIGRLGSPVKGAKESHRVSQRFHRHGSPLVGVWGGRTEHHSKEGFKEQSQGSGTHHRGTLTG